MTLFTHFFKPIETEEESLLAIKECFYITCFMSILTTVFILFFNYNKSALVDSIMIITLGFILFCFKSRTISILLFCTMIFEFAYLIYTKSSLSPVFWILYIGSTYRAMIASFKYHQIKNGKTSLKNFIIKNLISFAYVISFIIVWFPIKFVLLYPLVIVYHIIFGKDITYIQTNNILTALWLFGIIITYFISFIGMLPFTKKYKIITYSENIDNNDVDQYNDNGNFLNKSIYKNS